MVTCSYCENDPSMYDLGNFVLEQALWDSKSFLQQKPSGIGNQ
jgi:hypothetical protein